VSTLLHCEIGTGSIIFELLRDIINEHIEIYAPEGESIRLAIPVLKQIIASTATQWDNRGNSPDGNNWKTLKCAVAAYRKRSLITNNEQKVSNYKLNIIKLKHL
jgi:hypothetical protein